MEEKKKRGRRTFQIQPIFRHGLKERSFLKIHVHLRPSAVHIPLRSGIRFLLSRKTYTSSLNFEF